MADDTREYAGLLSLVYGGMKFENAEQPPSFLRELPRIVFGNLAAPDEHDR